VGALDVGRHPVAPETDRARTFEPAEVAGGGADVGVRLEAKPARVGHRAPHQVAGQLGRSLQRSAVEPVEEGRHEPAQLLFVPWPAAPRRP
jgi:hypothetical protein